MMRPLLCFTIMTPLVLGAAEISMAAPETNQVLVPLLSAKEPTQVTVPLPEDSVEEKNTPVDESMQVTVEVEPESAPEEVTLLGSMEDGNVEQEIPLKNDPVPLIENNALREAMAYVYEHHPQLMAEREKVKSIDESFAQAVSGFRPDVSADYGKGRERRSSNGAPWGYGDTETKGLTVTQPIFSGLDTVASMKSAKQRVKAARADLVALEQQLLFNVVVAYTAVVEAQSVLELTQNNVDVLDKQREATQLRFDVGELTRTDVSQSEARLAAAKADEQQAVGDLAIARADFERAVGYPPPEHVKMPQVPDAIPATLEEATTLARAASPVIEAARHREKAFASDINVQTGSLLPDVNLQGTMRRSEGGNIFTSRYDTDAITLNVSIPLYQSGAEWSRLRQAKKVANQAKFSTMDTILAVQQDVTSAWQNYVTAQSVIVSTEAVIKASDTALEGVRVESDYGVRTVLDVLDAEQEFLNAKVNYVRATRNHKIQAYRLLASVGKLTAHELSLPVNLYEPKDHYNNIKYQLLGW